MEYNLTNQASTEQTLKLIRQQGVSQIIKAGKCPKTIKLGPHASCVLRLKVIENFMDGYLSGGPSVCQRGRQLQCYQPNTSDQLVVSMPLPIIRVALYADPQCTQFISTKENSLDTLDPNIACTITSYIDPTDGKKIYTSFSNLQCFADGVTVTKFAVHAGCDGTHAVENYFFSANECRQAVSHLGFVYEKLVNYRYSGTRDCKI